MGERENMGREFSFEREILLGSRELEVGLTLYIRFVFMFYFV